MRTSQKILKKKYALLGVLMVFLNLTLIFNTNLMKINLDANDDDDIYYGQTLTLASTSNYGFCKEITILNSQVSGTGSHSNFPVLISLIDTDLHDQCQTDGDDIAFYCGTTLLYFEIESFNHDYTSTEAKLVAWVQIPLLSTTTNTIIQMYFGNPTLVSSEVNPTGVWDSNYVGVWHLYEDPTGTIIDSTSNNNDGFSHGSMTPDDQISGHIDGSLAFDGNDDYIDLPSLTDLDFNETDELTLSAWINPKKSKFHAFISNSISDQKMFFLRTKNYKENAIEFGIYTSTGYSTTETSSNVLQLDKWSYVVGVYNSIEMIIYVDGVKISSVSRSGNLSRVGPNDYSVKIGSEGDGDGNNFNGTIDETRISSIPRSADWIATEFNNQNDPSSFYTVGSVIINGFQSPSDLILIPLIIIIAISALSTMGLIVVKKHSSKSKIPAKTKHSRNLNKPKVPTVTKRIAPTSSNRQNVYIKNQKIIIPLSGNQQLRNQQSRDQGSGDQKSKNQKSINHQTGVQKVIVQQSEAQQAIMQKLNAQQPAAQQVKTPQQKTQNLKNYSKREIQKKKKENTKKN